MNEVIEAIRALLSADTTINELYKFIYHGKAPIPASSELPCIEVYPINTSMRNLGTQSMMNIFTIGIRVKDTLKKHITEDTNKSVIAHTDSFEKRIEDRDSTGRPDHGTILRVLHDNRQLSSTASIHEVQSVDYDTRELDKESLIIHADIKITVNRISAR